MDKIQVQVLFAEDTEFGTYTDALYYPFEDWPIDEKTIEIEKATRIQNYIDTIKNAPPPIPPTKEDLQKQIDFIGQQLSEVAQKAVELDFKLDVTPIKVDEVPTDVKPGGK